MSVMNEEMSPLTGYAASANSTMYSVVSASFNGLNLVSILPIVLVAALIVALVVGGCYALNMSGAMD